MLAPVDTVAGDLVIVKHAQPRRWTTVDRQTINDDALSFRARGVLIWLLDKPEDWQWSSETVADEGLEGREAIRTAVRELEARGYVTRSKRQLEDGRWVTEVWVYERPEDRTKPETGSWASVPGSRASGDRASDPWALSSPELKPNTGDDLDSAEDHQCPNGCNAEGWIEDHDKSTNAGSARRCDLHPHGRMAAA